MADALDLRFDTGGLSSADFSPCTIHLADCTPACHGRLYRYRLIRRWGVGLLLASIGLNPSTADADKNDPTISREIKLARRLGFAGLVKGNLFAARTTDPDRLTKFGDPVGPENDHYLQQIVRQAGRIVVTWGSHAMARPRAHEVCRHALRGAASLWCLGLTKEGAPRHPLDRTGAVNARTELVPFEIKQ